MDMCMTCVPLGERTKYTKAILSSPSRVHGVVDVAAGDNRTRTDPGTASVQWRVEQVPSKGLCLFVVSPGPVDLGVISRGLCLPSVPATASCREDYGDYVTSLQAGERLRFRLAAMPTVSAGGRKDAGRRGRRVRLDGTEQQAAWLIGTQEGVRGVAGPDDYPGKPQFCRDRLAGFSVVRDADGCPLMSVTAGRVTRFRHHGEKMSVQLVTYDGILEVTDPALLSWALAHGMGKGKAFGAGLLTVNRQVTF